MSEVIWIPGLGNTETFDGALIPPGGYLVSGGPPKAPTPSPAPSAPSTAVTYGYTAPVSYSPTSVVSSVPKTQTVDPAAVARAARAAEMAANTVWDNIPAVRALQEQDWQIYVDTGSWSSPQQTALHQQAEQIRMATNPLYKGSGAAGPPTQAAENQVALPFVPPDASLGKIGTTVALGVGAIILLALVKG